MKKIVLLLLILFSIISCSDEKKIDRIIENGDTTEFDNLFDKYSSIEEQEDE